MSTSSLASLTLFVLIRVSVKQVSQHLVGGDKDNVPARSCETLIYSSVSSQPVKSEGASTINQII